MNENAKIPERCSFKLVELKKKGRQRTAKIEFHHEFDEVVTNQRIMMIYDFNKQLLEIEEAEKEHSAAMYNNNRKLLDTEDEHSLSNEAVRTGEKVEMLKKRLEQLKELHKDFDFTAKVIQHKLKFKEEILITEIIYQVDKKVIYRFDDFGSFLQNYEMLIRDYTEREKSQKQGLLETAASESYGTKFVGFSNEDAFVLYSVVSSEETMIGKAREIIRRAGKASATMLQRELDISFPLAAQLIDQLEKEGIVGPQEGAKPRKVFGGPIQVADFSLEDNEQTKMFRDLMKRKVEETMIAEKMKEIFETLAILYKGKIDHLKEIIEGRRRQLDIIQQKNDVVFKSILSIAIQEAETEKENGMKMMITLAAGFDFIEILKQYE